jgi:hypothetical protein
MNEYFKNKEQSSVNDLILLMKLLEKQEQATTKTRRKREIIKYTGQN